MNLKAVREGLAARAATIPGLRTWAYVPGAISPPAFVVAGIAVQFDQAMQRGLDIVDLTCRVYVAKGSDRQAQADLDALLIGSGPTSIKAAIQAEHTLGGAVHWARLESISDYGGYEFAENEYLGATLTVRVAGAG